MNRVVLSAMAAVFVSGCASTAVWRHPERMGDGHDGATMALAKVRRDLLAGGGDLASMISRSGVAMATDVPMVVSAMVGSFETSCEPVTLNAN